LFRSGDVWSIDLSSRFVRRGAVYLHLFESDVIHYPIAPSVSGYVCCSTLFLGRRVREGKETEATSSSSSRRGDCSGGVADPRCGCCRRSPALLFWCVVALCCSYLYLPCSSVAASIGSRFWMCARLVRLVARGHRVRDWWCFGSHFCRGCAVMYG